MAAARAATAHLVESMLHDARNPLNALAINLEVLTEKLKDEGGGLAPALEKNIRAMREQVFRVDAILRTFAEFLVTQPSLVADLPLPQVMERAQDVLGHEARKRRVKISLEVEPGVTARMEDPVSARFLAYQSLLRALLRSEPGTEVKVTLRRSGERAALRVQDGGGGGEPNPLLAPALQALGRARGVEVSIDGGSCVLGFPAG